MDACHSLDVLVIKLNRDRPDLTGLYQAASEFLIEVSMKILR